jgi:hypothetical protein
MKVEMKWIVWLAVTVMLMAVGFYLDLAVQRSHQNQIRNAEDAVVRELLDRRTRIKATSADLIGWIWRTGEENGTGNVYLFGPNGVLEQTTIGHGGWTSASLLSWKIYNGDLIWCDFRGTVIKHYQIIGTHKDRIYCKTIDGGVDSFVRAKSS